MLKQKYPKPIPKSITGEKNDFVIIVLNESSVPP